MTSNLDRTNIDAHSEGPGVAFLLWHHPDNAFSRALRRDLEQLSRRHEDVRVGIVDASASPALVREHTISVIPTLMLYRDGVLLFSRSGPLPALVLEGLVEAAFSLNMERVRQGIDGEGVRLFGGLQPQENPEGASRSGKPGAT